MAYSYVTLAQAQADLQARLYNSASDPTQQQWTPSELQRYLVESLRTWNAITSSWRDDFTFPLTSIAWYDLTAQANSLRPMTVSDLDLLLQIENHLIEPQTPAYPLAWTGSSQFALSDILGAIQAARDVTLSSTGCTITRSLIPVPVGRVALSDSIIDIRRVAWIPDPGFGYSATALQASDLETKESFDPGWTTAPQAVPGSYMVSGEPPLSIDLDRVPPVPGDLELLTVNAGAPLTAAAATVLGIPDDWGWLVKWGALSQLLGREGLAKDGIRAKYCDQRFKSGLDLLEVSPALLSLRINSLPLGVDSVSNGDDFRPGWQSRVPWPPDAAYYAGLNLLGFPPPDAGPYSILATVVRNAPVPTSSSDYLQVGRDTYDSILDYAQHLAMFKLGGKEFLSTMPLLQGCLRQAAESNSKLMASGFFQKSMYELSQLERARNPAKEKSR